MTEQEKQEIILAVLVGLKVHSMTIDQLTESTTVGDSDYIELNGGRKISFKKFSELVLGQIAENIRMKANLNTQNALSTGEEQRLVIRIIEQSERPVVLKQGVYYNENSQHIETYEVRDMHGSAVLRLVLSEEPSKNVVYCDEDTNTLLRWDGAEMVKVGGGGEIDAYTKSESDKRYAKLSNSQQAISLGYALFGNEAYEVRVDGEGIMWVNGERVVTTDDETQRVFAELVKAVTVKAEELWLGQNENVLTVENGKLKVDGKSILEDVSGEDIPLESGAETTVYDAVIDLYGKVPKVVQTTGSATDKVMSQDAVTKALASADGGEPTEVVTITLTEDVHEVVVSKDANGNPLSLKKIFIGFNMSPYSGERAVCCDTISTPLRLFLNDSASAITLWQMSTAQRCGFAHISTNGGLHIWSNELPYHNSSTALQGGYNQQSINNITSVKLQAGTGSAKFVTGLKIHIYTL